MNLDFKTYIYSCSKQELSFLIIFYNELRKIEYDPISMELQFEKLLYLSKEQYREQTLKHLYNLNKVIKIINYDSKINTLRMLPEDYEKIIDLFSSFISDIVFRFTTVHESINVFSENIEKSYLEEILDDFKEFCTNEIISGKANSYKLAIKYLCDFLNITYIDKDKLIEIKNATDSLKDKNSSLYIECLNYLKNKGRSSYLLKGYFSAAVNNFIIFINNRCKF